jgi:iron complex transport system permease protein
MMPCFDLKNKTLACQILWNLRVNHAVSLAISGVALAMSGTLLQGLLRNPLADPGLLGVSAATGFFLLLGAGIGLSMLGLLGACVGLALMGAGIGWWWLQRQRAQMSSLRIILLGLLINGFFMALSQVLLTLSSDQTLRWYFDWTLYGQSEIPLGLLGGSVAIVVMVWLSVPSLMRALDVWQLGADELLASGMCVRRLFGHTVWSAALLCAISVLLSGPLAFVGLLAPHLARAQVGCLHRHVLPRAAMMGVMMIWAAETLRHLLPDLSLPLSLVLTLLGLPCVCVILSRGKEVFHDS